MSYVRGIEGKRSTEVTEPGNITKPLTPARKLPQSGSEKQGGCLALLSFRRAEERKIESFRNIESAESTSTNLKKISQALTYAHTCRTLELGMASKCLSKHSVFI